jgi:Xaa-Pro aminopeptidase
MLVARAGFRVLKSERWWNAKCASPARSRPRIRGHGIGRTIHELPHIPNYPDPEARQIMNEGLVIAVEPIISSGSGQVFTDKDALDGADGRSRAFGAF